MELCLTRESCTAGQMATHDSDCLKKHALVAINTCGAWATPLCHCCGLNVSNLQQWVVH